MSKVRIELNSAGIRELLRSEEMGAIVEGHAAAVAGRCGEGYASDRKLMPGRVIASAYTDTKEARRDNSENHTLLKSLGG